MPAGAAPEAHQAPAPRARCRSAPDACLRDVPQGRPIAAPPSRSGPRAPPRPARWPAARAEDRVEVQRHQVRPAARRPAPWPIRTRRLPNRSWRPPDLQEPSLLQRVGPCRIGGEKRSAGAPSVICRQVRRSRRRTGHVWPVSAVEASAASVRASARLAAAKTVTRGRSVLHGRGGCRILSKEPCGRA
jgi:hypothetical protein